MEGSMNTQFEILLDILNSTLKALNDREYYLKDPLNPEFYIERVYYNSSYDELHCYFKEV